MELLLRQIVEPDIAVIMGGSWRIPVMEGLLDKNFVSELKMDGTYNENSFDREYKRFLYSLNIVNCWKIFRAFPQQHEDEISLSAIA